MATHVLNSSTSVDVLCGGRLHIAQRRDGYRCGIDALLLASCAAPLAGRTLVDICAGSGVVGLATAAMNPTVRHVTAIELQPEMAACARHNFEQARLDDWQLIQQDVRLTRPQSAGQLADLVTINPPFYQPHAGRVSPNPIKAAARHLLNGTLDELIEASLRWARPDAWVVATWPADAIADLDRAFGAQRWRRVRTLWMSSAEGVDSHLAIAAYAHQSSHLDSCETTQCIYVAKGSPIRNYTPPMKALVDGAWEQPLPHFCC